MVGVVIVFGKCSVVGVVLFCVVTVMVVVVAFLCG